MKLSEFIKKLQHIESEGGGDIPVVLDDWCEGYATPSEGAAEEVVKKIMPYWPTENKGRGRAEGVVVCIGTEVGGY